MSRRWAILGLSNSLTVLVVGQMLTWFNFPLNYQVVFIGSAVGALISVVFSSSIKLPPRQRAARLTISLAQMSGGSGVRRRALPWPVFLMGRHGELDKTQTGGRFSVPGP